MEIKVSTGIRLIVYMIYNYSSSKIKLKPTFRTSNQSVKAMIFFGLVCAMKAEWRRTQTLDQLSNSLSWYQQKNAVSENVNTADMLIPPFCFNAQSTIPLLNMNSSRLIANNSLLTVLIHNNNNTRVWYGLALHVRWDEIATVVSCHYLNKIDLTWLTS